MLERNTVNVRNVRSPAIISASLGLRDSVMGSDAINVRNVRRVSNRARTSLSTRESTQGRSLMDVLSVGKASVRVQPSLNTGELTLGKNLINVWNVEEASDKARTLSDTKGSIEIKARDFDMLLCNMCFVCSGFGFLVQKLFFGIWSIPVTCGLYFLGHPTHNRIGLTCISVYTLYFCEGRMSK